MEKIRSAGTGDAVRGGAAENAAPGSHRVMIDNREKLTMTDIADIDSFDEQEIHAKLCIYTCWISEPGRPRSRA